MITTTMESLFSFIRSRKTEKGRKSVYMSHEEEGQEAKEQGERVYPRCFH